VAVGLVTSGRCDQIHPGYVRILTRLPTSAIISTEVLVRRTTAAVVGTLAGTALLVGARLGSYQASPQSALNAAKG
jgi:hypothetical protein